MNTPAKERAIISRLEWSGDHDALVTVFVDESAGGPAREFEVDRPGDMMMALTEHRFENDDLLCAGAALGVCLAMRGLENPNLIPQVLEGAMKFMVTADVVSLKLYRTFAEMRALIAAQSELDGFALRDRICGEAHRLLLAACR